MLDKCIILEICGILSDNFCINSLDNNKKTKILLIKILIHFVMNHKNENLTLWKKKMMMIMMTMEKKLILVLIVKLKLL